MLKSKDLLLGRPLRRASRFPGYGQHAFATETNITTAGTQLTANASANTKATSYTTLIASLAADCDGFFLNLLGGTASRDLLVDIAIGASSSEVNIIDNFMLSSGTTLNLEVREVYIPIPIAAGTRVSARCQASTGSATCFAGVSPVKSRYAFSFSKATTYGANTGDSGGTSIDPGGTINTLPANMTQLSAAITDPIRYLIACIGNGGNFTRTTCQHSFQIGYGGSGSETVVVPLTYITQDAGRDTFTPTAFSKFVDIETGQRLAARQNSSINDASDRLFDMTVIGFS